MKFFILLFVVGCALALPRTNYKRYAQAARYQAALARPRRAPVHHRTMFISGLYQRPLYAQRRQAYEPETSMTAFAAGDSVAAGSYLGSRAPGCASCGEQDNTEFVGDEPLGPAQEFDQPEAPLADIPAEAPLDEPAAEVNNEELVPAPLPPKRKANKKLKAEEEDDVGEEDSAIVPGRQGTYFPIVFRGYGGRSGAGGSGGGVTAIANSYSTGKGGVATSHATAYGGPAPSKSKKRKAPVPDDDEDDE